MEGKRHKGTERGRGADNFHHHQSANCAGLVRFAPGGGPGGDKRALTGSGGLWAKGWAGRREEEAVASLFRNRGATLEPLAPRSGWRSILYTVRFV